MLDPNFGRDYISVYKARSQPTTFRFNGRTTRQQFMARNPSYFGRNKSWKVPQPSHRQILQLMHFLLVRWTRLQGISDKDTSIVPLKGQNVRLYRTERIESGTRSLWPVETVTRTVADRIRMRIPAQGSSQPVRSRAMMRHHGARDDDEDCTI